MYTSERHKPCHEKIDGANLNQSCSFQKLFCFCNAMCASTPTTMVGHNIEISNRFVA